MNDGQVADSVGLHGEANLVQPSTMDPRNGDLSSFATGFPIDRVGMKLSDKATAQFGSTTINFNGSVIVVPDSNPIKEAISVAQEIGQGIDESGLPTKPRRRRCLSVNLMLADFFRRLRERSRRQLVWLSTGLLLFVLVTTVLPVALYYSNSSDDNWYDDLNIEQTYADIGKECNTTVTTRKMWNAIARDSDEVCRERSMRKPTVVIVDHTASPACLFNSTCIKMVQTIQQQQFRDGKCNMKYNFLIGGNGKIYEGLGFFKYQAISANFDSKTLTLGIIGNFFTNESIRMSKPKSKQSEVGYCFLKASRKRGLVTKDYVLTISAQLQNNTAFADDVKMWV